MRSSLTIYGAFLFTSFAAVALVHCGGDDSSPVTSDDGGSDGSTRYDASPRDSGKDVAVSDAATRDAALTPFCAAALNSQTVCYGFDGTCGDAGDYATLCDAFDENVNSQQFRDAFLMCTGPDDAGCSPLDRRDCQYKLYSNPTAAQQKLATDYCATCHPGDASCAAAALAYDGGNPSPVFGVYEVSDSVANQTDTQCTGAAFDAGGDCDEAFTQCESNAYVSGNPYVVPFLNCQ